MRGAVMAILLAMGAAPAALAQSVQDTARQAEVPRTPAASDLQSYALVLQEAEQRVQRAKQQHDGGRTQSQAGAASQERIDLMQATRAAWREMQHAPAAFAETADYKDADRRIREEFGDIGPDRSLSREKASEAAGEVIRVLAELRDKVVAAASRAGGEMPAPTSSGGGR